MPKARVPKMSRFHFLGIENRVTIRTFNKETYILHSGLVVINVRTNRKCSIHEIFYDIRTVRSIEGKVIARRKNKVSDLCAVKAS